MKPLLDRVLQDRLRPHPRPSAFDSVSQTEKVIAFCRVLLATTTLVVAIVDPVQPSYRPDIGYIVLGTYVIFSALLFWLVRGEHVNHDLIGPYSTLLDILWIVPISLFTDRGATPFFLVNIFVISSVSVRWGFRVAAPITVFLALLYPALIVLAGRFLDEDVFNIHRGHLFRPVYLVALGHLIGYLGEHERRSKRKLGFMLELATSFRPNQAPARGLTRLMRRVLQVFDSPRGLLVVHDPDSGNCFTWDMMRRDGRVRLRLRITSTDPLPFDLTTPTEAMVANTLPPASGTALLYDVATGAMRRRAVGPELTLPDGEGAQALLAVPVLVQGERRGRVVLVREGRRRFTQDDLQFLLLVVGQAAASFEAVRLQQKAEEVAVLEERARIARDLHDGFIQSLAGIDLRVEACRKLLERDPGRLPRQLADLQEAVDRGYREVRHYLSVLRSASRQAQDLHTMLDRLAAEFSMREHLRVDLAVPQVDPGLPATAVYEVTQIVREALRNAVRHGRASEAAVSLTVNGANCALVIRDNGRGFQNVRGMIDGDGILSPAAAPWSIRDRAAALGGTLRIRSRPDEGVEISIVLPRDVAEPPPVRARRSA